MADRSGSHGAQFFVNLSSFENFQTAMKATLNRQVQLAMAHLEASYQSHALNNPHAPGVQVSVNINYNIRLTDTTDTQADSNNQADISQDMARLNLDLGDPVGESETNQRDTEDRRNDEAVPQETIRIHFDIDGPVNEINQSATQNNLFEQARSPLQYSIFDLLLGLPLADLEDPAPDCPVCYEQFPESEGEEDEAIVLDCNHVIGFDCMERWIGDGNNSCPLCRALVFDPVVLAALADREELSGRPRPIFRTAVLEAAAEDRTAAAQAQEREAAASLQHQQEILDQFFADLRPIRRDRFP